MQRRHITKQSPIAITGYAGRFPGAESLDVYWDGLLNGRDLLTRLSASDISSASTIDYVPIAGIVPGAGELDCAVFPGISDKPHFGDPQVQLLLELSWECLEHGG